MTDKLTAAQTRVMSWIGKGWSARPAYGSVIEVNGKRICNADTMMALSRKGLAAKDGAGQWVATESGKSLVARTGI